MKQKARARDVYRSGNGALIGIVLAMVVVMTAIVFTLQKNSSRAAAGPQIAPSEPTAVGEGDVAPVRPQSGPERSIERYPDPRARERPLRAVGPGPRNSSRAP